MRGHSIAGTPERRRFGRQFDARVRLSSLAIVLGTVVLLIVPVAMAWSGTGREAAVDPAQLVAFGAGLVLLVVVGPPPAVRVVRRGATLVAIVAGVLVIVAVAMALVASVGTLAFRADAILAEIILLGWCVLTIRLMALGIARGEPAAVSVALGLLVLSTMCITDVAMGVGSSQREDAFFHTARLAGVLVVLFGALAFMRHALVRLRAERDELEDELRIAAVSAQRASRTEAAHDHELRNGLTGLYGVIDTLGAGSEDAAHQRLRLAALREIARLSAMVERIGQRTAPGVYDVGAAVAEVTMLRKACGVPIIVDCAPGLWAAGRAATFIQVITNVIANCVRHAPGASVLLQCHAAGATIVVRVVDDGPGPPPGFAQLDVASGVRRSSAGGEGLGLHISSTLLTGEGGRLRFLPTDSGGGGFTVVIELPRATPDRVAVPGPRAMAVRTP